MNENVLHLWRVRHELNAGKIITTRHRMTDEEARLQFGDRLVERLDDTREVRTGASDDTHTGHVQRGFSGHVP